MMVAWVGDATMCACRAIGSKIRGVSHRNRDGSSRQAALRKCQVGEQLQLVREPENPVDFNAIKICRRDGRQLGYVSADLVEEFNARMRNGYRYTAFVKGLTSGDNEIVGCNIVIVVIERGTPDEEIHNFYETEIPRQIQEQQQYRVATALSNGKGCLLTLAIFGIGIGVVCVIAGT